MAVQETRISPPPLRTPMFDRAGVMSRPWQVWFGELFVRAAAEADQEVLEAHESAGRDWRAQIEQIVEVRGDAPGGEMAARMAAIETAQQGERPYAGQVGREAEALARELSGVTPAEAARLMLEQARAEMALSAQQQHRILADPADFGVGRCRPVDDPYLSALTAHGARKPPVLLLARTHAERAARPAGAYPEGTVYYETDRGLYYVSVDKAWRYLAGVCVTASLAGKPTDLGAADAGVLWYSSDYAHLWRFTGSGWEYAPGDRPSGEVAWYCVAPGAGWALCNGALATRTKSDATTEQVVLPNLIDSYVKGAAAYDANVHPAVGGAFTGNPLPTHRHATPFVLTGTGRLVWKSWRWGGYSSEWVTNAKQIQGVNQDPNGEQLWWDSVSPDSAGTPSGTVSAGDVQHVHLMPYYRL